MSKLRSVLSVTAAACPVPSRRINDPLNDAHSNLGFLGICCGPLVIYPRNVRMGHLPLPGFTELTRDKGVSFRRWARPLVRDAESGSANRTVL